MKKWLTFFHRTRLNTEVLEKASTRLVYFLMVALLVIMMQIYNAFEGSYTLVAIGFGLVYLFDRFSSEPQKMYVPKNIQRTIVRKNQHPLQYLRILFGEKFFYDSSGILLGTGIGFLIFSLAPWFVMTFGDFFGIMFLVCLVTLIVLCVSILLRLMQVTLLVFIAKPKRFWPTLITAIHRWTKAQFFVAQMNAMIIVSALCYFVTALATTSSLLTLAHVSMALFTGAIAAFFTRSLASNYQADIYSK